MFLDELEYILNEGFIYVGTVLYDFMYLVCGTSRLNVID